MAQPFGFIFDLDGTLVDSLMDIHTALLCAMREMRLAPHTPEQTRAWVGDGLVSLCARAAPNLDPATQEEFLRAARRHYREHLTEFTRPYPNIMPLLELLQSRKIPCAVLSNKPHDLTCTVIDGLGMRKYFVEVLGNRREEDRKPSPVDALFLAQKMGLAPGQIFLVGDSSADILAARNAGMISVAVTWGFRSRSELSEFAPDAWIEDALEAEKLSKKFFFEV